MTNSVLILAMNSSTQELMESIRSFKRAGMWRIMVFNPAKYGFLPVMDSTVKLFHTEESLLDYMESVDEFVYVTKKFDAPADFSKVVFEGNRDKMNVYGLSGVKLINTSGKQRESVNMEVFDRRPNAVRYIRNDDGDVVVDSFSDIGYLIWSKKIVELSKDGFMHVFERAERMSRACIGCKIPTIVIDTPWGRPVRTNAPNRTVKRIPSPAYRRNAPIVRTSVPIDTRAVSAEKEAAKRASELKELRVKYEGLSYDKPFFGVVIPVYKSCETLRRGLESIANQSFKYYKTYVCDDESGEPYASRNEASVKEILGDRGWFTRAEKKLYAGGCRDICLDRAKKDGVTYMLFLDSDDHFEYSHFFEDLHAFILENKNPDVVVLPSFQEMYNSSNLVSARECVSPETYSEKQGFVPPWSKCVRAEICPKFESGLRRSNDVLQHMRVVDTVETVTNFPCVAVRRKMDGETTLHGDAAPKNVMCVGALTGMLKCMVQILEETYKHGYTRKAVVKTVTGTLRRAVPSILSEIGDNLENLIRLDTGKGGLADDAPLVTATFAGQLGNVMLSVYTCFWYARKKGIPFDRVLFNRSYVFHGKVNRSDDYIADNMPIFRNIKDNFLRDDEYQSETGSRDLDVVGVETRKKIYDDDIKEFGNAVRICKYVWHFPQNDEDRKLFMQLFNVKEEMGRQREKYKDEFDPSSSVALHVRRTDYATFKHGVYMETAEDILKKLEGHEGETVVVFSDDIEWCRDNIASEKCNIVFHDPQPAPYEDMVLMSLFKDIESNMFSTYSYCARLMDENISELPEKEFK